MNNETDVSIRFRNYVTGEGKLEKYAKTLAKIKSVTDGIDSKVLSSVEKNADELKNMNNETDKMAKNINTAFNYTVVREFTRGLKSAFTALGKLTDKSASYLENINLFQVAFNGSYQEAERFINKMSEMYGLDESGLTNTVGIFRQLANAMNLSTETGTKLATLLSQMTVDISSLYNIDISRASSILQSSLAGQTKPIRGATGADITESTLQTTLNALDIDRYVGDLSYAEKRLLIIISLTEQLSESTNDFARTIESPANQMRILNEQWERLSRAVGNMFLPILSQVLPYLNAILMVLTEIISVIATFLGYSEDDYDYFAGVADSALELEESLGGASENAKKLKQGLRSFDKLNVIKTPSAGATGGASGIDPDIMNAFNDAFDEYNSKLTEVQMKASKIRDSIMEWFGFTKKINSETGEIDWEFEKITGGTILGALAGTGLLISGMTKIYNILKKMGLLKFTGITKIINSIKGGKVITTITSAFSKLLPILTKVGGAVAGIAGVIFGSSGTYNAMKKMREESEYGGEAYGKYALSILETVGGATALGAVIGGPLGAGIGALTGVVISGISAWQGYKAGVEAVAKEELFGSLTISTEKWLEIMDRANENLPNYASKYETFKSKIDSLKSSFDSNLESLEIYGIQFGKLQQQITEEDTVKIAQSIENMCSSTSSMIEENSTLFLSVWGTSFKKMSTLTEEEEKDILNSVMNYSKKQQEELKTAQDNITRTYDNAIKTRGYLTDEEYNYISTQLAKIKSLTHSEMSTAYTDMLYMQEEFSKDTSKLSEESYEEFSEALKQYTKEQEGIISENYNTQLNLAKRYYDEKAIDYDQYQKMIDTANEERKKSESDLRSSLYEIQKDIYGDLAQTYKDIQDLTDEESKAQKKIIEGIFKDIDIDASGITRAFSDIGHENADAWRKSFIEDMNKKIKIRTQLENGPISETSCYIKANAYADGGLPPVGQLFVANERGPELIGNIGGQSFVANQNQVLDLLDRKIASTNNGMKNATFVIQVGDEVIAKKVLNDLQDMAKSDGKPIVIS